MYLKKTTISKINFFLDGIIEKEITGKKWIRLESGQEISPAEYKLLPTSFDVENPESIRTVKGAISDASMSKEVYENLDDVEEFMGQYSTKTIDLDTISKDLSDSEYVEQLNPETHTQLLTSAIREAKIEEALNEDAVSQIQSYLVKTNDETLESLENIANSEGQIDSVLRQELSERLGSSEIDWVQKQVGAKDLIRDEDKEDETESTSIFELKKEDAMKTIHIARWRDAEIKCVLIEESMGNTATDVSLKNYGYDVESVTPDGKTRYIEVKSVKKDFPFSMTNNEYTAVHQYGEDYYVCLLFEDEESLNVRYIKNPLNNAKFEKRIKQWEWICLECNSTSMTFELE